MLPTSNKNTWRRTLATAVAFFAAVSFAQAAYAGDEYNGAQKDEHIYGAQKNNLHVAPKSRACRCSSGCCRECSWIRVSADYLSFQRSSIGTPTSALVIGGPDAFSTGGANNLGHQNGWRLLASIDVHNWTLEGVFTDFGSWNASRNGSLNGGVSFDGGISPGNPWSAQNFINATTLFSPIMASSTGGAEADEFDGFGPANANFLTDDPPTFNETYRSDLEIAEFNVLSRYFSGRKCRSWRVGAGYSHVGLDELASVSLTGTYRALNVGGPNGGLLHASLTGMGGLTLLSGNGNGFSDGEGNHPTDGNPNVADTLVFTANATVSNELNGFQLVYDSILFDGSRFDVNARITAGIYENSVGGMVSDTYVDEDSVYGRIATDTTSKAAFAGSAQAVGKYWVRDWLAVTGGYEVTFISGVALANQQTLDPTAYQVNADGNVLAHGARFGLEARY